MMKFDEIVEIKYEKVKSQSFWYVRATKMPEKGVWRYRFPA